MWARWPARVFYRENATVVAEWEQTSYKLLRERYKTLLLLRWGRVVASLARREV